METTTTQPSDSLTAPTAHSEDTTYSVHSPCPGAGENPPEATPLLSPGATAPPPPPPGTTVAAASQSDDGPRSPRHPISEAATAWKPEVRLPSGPFGFEDTGDPIFREFSRRHSLFVQHRTVVERMLNRTNGCDELKVVTSLRVP